MVTVRAVFVALLLLVVARPSFAVECGVGIPIFRVAARSSCPWLGSKGSAAAGAVACVEQGGYHECVLVNAEYNSGNSARYQCKNSLENVIYPTYSYATSTGDIPCVPTTCSGSAADGVGDQFTTGTSPGADGYCNPVSHCRMQVTSSVAVDGTAVFLVKHTSQDCPDQNVPPPPVDALTDGETCTATSPQFCLQKSGTNCGYLGEKFVCLPKVGDSKCAVAEDGGRVCGNRAPMPPVHDNGTPGQPATPAAVVTSTVNNVTTTMNYFSATQVATSARDPGDSGANPYDGDVNGDEEETEGGGAAEGGDDCAAPPSCTGDPVGCMIAKQGWLERCGQGIPSLGSMMGEGEHPSTLPGTSIDITDAIQPEAFLGGPSCPADVEVSLGAWGTAVIPFSEFCSLFNVIGIFVLAWAWLSAARIVVGAPAVSGS